MFKKYQQNLINGMTINDKWQLNQPIVELLKCWIATAEVSVSNLGFTLIF